MGLCYNDYDREEDKYKRKEGNITKSFWLRKRISKSKRVWERVLVFFFV